MTANYRDSFYEARWKLEDAQGALRELLPTHGVPTEEQVLVIEALELLEGADRNLVPVENSLTEIGSALTTLNYVRGCLTVPGYNVSERLSMIDRAISNVDLRGVEQTP